MASKRKTKQQRHITPSPPSQAHDGTQHHGLISTRTTEFSGPLPPPDILAGYDQLSPGAADRIIVMAETEATHRRELERKTVDSEIKNEESRNQEARIGQMLAFVIGLFTIVCGTYAAVSGAEIAGSFIGTGGVASLVTAFIYGRKTK